MQNPSLFYRCHLQHRQSDISRQQFCCAENRTALLIAISCQAPATSNLSKPPHAVARILHARHFAARRSGSPPTSSRIIRAPRKSGLWSLGCRSRCCGATGNLIRGTPTVDRQPFGRLITRRRCHVRTGSALHGPRVHTPHQGARYFCTVVCVQFRSSIPMDRGRHFCRRKTASRCMRQPISISRASSALNNVRKVKR